MTEDLSRVIPGKLTPHRQKHSRSAGNFRDLALHCYPRPSPPPASPLRAPVAPDPPTVPPHPLPRHQTLAKPGGKCKLGAGSSWPLLPISSSRVARPRPPAPHGADEHGLSESFGPFLLWPSPLGAWRTLLVLKASDQNSHLKKKPANTHHGTAADFQI